MRAALLHGPGDLRVEDVPDPEPGPGELVLGIRAALSCATDVKSVARGHPSIAGYPSRLGHEFAGVVERLGAGVEGFSVGDAVFCADSAPCGRCRACRRGRESLCEDLLYLLGGFGERLLVPERVVRGNLHRLPLACAAHALDAAELEPGDSVAIVGGGSLGLMLCALASDAGGRVIVLDPHRERLAAAARFGAAATVAAERGPGDVERVRALSDGRGADLVVEAVGRPRSWQLAVAMAAPGGTANLFGGCARGTSVTLPTERIHYEEVRVLGTYHHAPRYVARALAVLARRAWPWAQLLGPQIGLDELPAALAGRLHAPVPPKYTVVPE